MWLDACLARLRHGTWFQQQQQQQCQHQCLAAHSHCAVALKDSCAPFTCAHHLCPSRSWQPILCIRPTCVSCAHVQEMLSDANPMVVANAIAALSEIQEQGGQEVLQITPHTLFKLLAALNECTEWGQVRMRMPTSHRATLVAAGVPCACAWMLLVSYSG